MRRSLTPRSLLDNLGPRTWLAFRYPPQSIGYADNVPPWV